MNYAFQDFDNLYLVMDLLNGGDLRYHICKHKKFSEEQTSKFLKDFFINFNFFFRIFRCLYNTWFRIYSCK
jgi:hypothetical protein